MQDRVMDIRTLVNLLLARLMIIGDTSHVSVDRWIGYVLSSSLLVSPFAFLLSAFDGWFANNHQFYSFIAWCMIFNVLVGSYRHIRDKTFNVTIGFVKLLKMGVLLCVSYVVLEMISITIMESLAGETFEVVIQVLLILIPGTKILKNIYILSNGTIPPRALMKVIYNFNENPDLRRFQMERTRLDKKFNNDDFDKLEKEIEKRKKTK